MAAPMSLGLTGGQDAPAAPPGAILSQMSYGYWVTQALRTAALLGIADQLVAAPRTVEEIAAATGAVPRHLYRLLRALAGLGVFAETADGRFTLTPLAEPLRSDVDGSVRWLLILIGDPEQYRSWEALVHSVRTGECAFDHVFGTSLFAYLGVHPEAAATFDRAMTGVIADAAQAITAVYDVSGYAHIVDVGGGVGTLLAALLRANPAMRGTLLDLPHVTEQARAFLQGHGVGDRVAVVAGDFFAAVPAGGDLYLLGSILHDWEDEQALAILRRCRQAMAPGTRLLIVGLVVPPGNTPSLSKLLDLHMMVITGGRERSEAEHRALLSASGFELLRVIPSGHPFADLVEACAV